ncbi:MAG: HIT family protein [Parcubacteria group bacterium]
MGCIFCKIIDSRSEDFIYEDEKAVVLVSKLQTSHGHIIVTLKKHYENINDISEEDYLHLQKLVKKYYEKLHKNFEPEKIYILLLAEEIAHIHFHLIPRYRGDATGPKFLMDDIKEVKNSNKIIEKLI